MDDWISVDEWLPGVGQEVWYFFDICGVHEGIYRGIDGGMPHFGGKSGFLVGDVTHWMPRELSDEEPPPPEISND